MMKKMFALLLAAGLLAGGAAVGQEGDDGTDIDVSDAAAWPAVSDATGTPGAWSSQYPQTKAAAKKAGLPCLVVFANSADETANAAWSEGVLQDQGWTDWVEDHRLYLVMLDYAAATSLADKQAWLERAGEYAEKDGFIYTPHVVLFGADGKRVSHFVADANEDAACDLTDADGFIEVIEKYLNIPVKPGPGRIGFSKSAAAVDADAPQVTVTVQRSGGTGVGAQTFLLQTHDDTATNGIHYGSVATTLTWAAGDASDRTVSIPLLAGEGWRQLSDRVFNVTLAKGMNTTAEVGITNLAVTVAGNFTAPTNWSYDASSGTLTSGTLTSGALTNGEPAEVTWTAPQAGLLSFKEDFAGLTGRLTVDVPGASPATNTLVLTLPNSMPFASSATNALLALALPRAMQPADGSATLTLNLPPDAASPDSSDTDTLVLAVTNGAASAESSHTVTLEVAYGAASARAVSTVVPSGSGAGAPVSFTNTLDLGAVTGTTVEARTATQTVTNGAVVAAHTVTLSVSNGVASVTSDAALVFLDAPPPAPRIETVELAIDNGTVSAASGHAVGLAVNRDTVLAMAVSTVASLGGGAGAPVSFTNTLDLGTVTEATVASQTATQTVTNGAAVAIHTMTLSVSNGTAEAAFSATLQTANNEKIASASNTVALAAGARVVWRASGTDSAASIRLLDWRPVAAPVPVSPANGTTFQLAAVNANMGLLALTWWGAATVPNAVCVVRGGVRASALDAALTNAVSGVSAAGMGLTNGVCYWRVENGVAGDFRTAVQAAGPVWSFEVTERPSFPSAATNVSLYVNLPAAFTVEAGSEASPVTYSAKGLPSGLKINAATGEVSGIPKRAGVFAVTVTAKSVKGTTDLSVTVAVTAWPAYASGPFQGTLLDADGRASGVLTLTVSSSGVPSLKIEAGGAAQTLKGVWLDVFVARFTTKAGETIDVALTEAGPSFTGLSADAGRVLKEGIAPYVGYYTGVLAVSDVVGAGALDNRPEGYGYLTFTVAKTGAVRYSGKLADGTGVSGSAKLLSGGEPGTAVFPLYKTLYARRGRLAARVAFSAGGAVALTSGVWDYPGKSAGQPEDFFVAEVSGGGAYYAKTVKAAGLAAVYAGGVFAVAGGEAGLEVAKGKLAAEAGSGVNLSVAAATGLFTGNFTGGDERRYAFKGVLVPALTNGAGYWLWPVSTNGYRVNLSQPVEIRGGE